MAATDIVIKLAMEGASVVGADIGSVKGNLKELGDTASSVTGLLTTLGITVSAGAFVHLIDGTIDSAAELKGLATQAGLTGDALSEFERVGKLSGTSAEDIASAVNKMQKAMIGAKDDTGNVSVALNALGIDFNTFKGMRPDEQLMTVADKMNDFADGTGKSQTAMVLFGKAGAGFLDYLHDLAVAEDLHGRFTQDQIDLSKDYHDKMAQLTVSASSWKDELVMGMLPAMDKAVTALLGMANETGGLHDKIKGLATDGTINEWMRNTITNLSYVIDAWAGLKVVVISTGDTIGFWMAKGMQAITSFGDVVSAFLSHDWNAMHAALVSDTQKQITLETAHQASFEQTWGEQTLGMKLRDRMADMKDFGGAVSDQRKPVGDLTDALTEQKKKLDDAAVAAKAAAAQTKAAADEAVKAKAAEDNWTTAIGLKIDAINNELDYGTKLTDSEKLQLQLDSDITKGTGHLTDAMIEERHRLIDVLAAREDVLNDMKIGLALKADDKKQEDALTKAHEDATTALEKQTDSMQAENDKMVDSTIKTLLGADGYAQYKIQMDLAEGSKLIMMGSMVDENGLVVTNSAELIRQGKILMDRADLASQGIVVKEAKDAQKAWEATTKAIGEDLTNALITGWESGKDGFIVFRDWLEAEFVKMVLTPTINFIVSPIAGAVNSGLSSITGGLIGNAATGTAAGAAGAAGGAGGGVLGAAGSALGVGAGGFTGTGITGAAGIGASAGAGVTATGVAGGTAAATDLGLLNTTAPTATIGAAAAGDAAGAGSGLGTLGAAAGAAAIFVGAVAAINAYVGHSRPLEHLDTGSIPDLAGVYARAVAIDQDHTQNVLIENVTYDHVRFLDDLSTAYAILGDGIALGSVASLADVNGMLAATYAHPSFGSGGDFYGGIRLVGERGPELELTGPSRIFDAPTTASMLRSGGASNDELIAEMRLLRAAVDSLHSDSSAENRAIAGHTGKTSHILDRAMKNNALTTRAAA